LNTGGVFRFAFFTLFIALLAIRGYFGWKARRSGHSISFTDDEEVQQPGSRRAALVIIIFLCMAGLLVLYGISPEGLSWLSAPLPDWLGWLGVGLAVIALGLQVWVHDTLHRHWSAHAQSSRSHILITDGPYRWVRHPMYAGLMLLFICLSLVSAFWPFLVLALLSIPMFRRDASKEEAVMIGRFGDQYRDYMKRTGRFLPRAFYQAG
jgi:protein-S-isoprenylcysteine O-methyltransferase Ste14